MGLTNEAPSSEEMVWIWQMMKFLLLSGQVCCCIRQGNGQRDKVDSISWRGWFLVSLDNAFHQNNARALREKKKK